MLRKPTRGRIRRGLDGVGWVAILRTKCVLTLSEAGLHFRVFREP